jgi:hypothetical protein
MDEILGGLLVIGAGCWAWHMRYNKRAFIQMLRAKPIAVLIGVGPVESSALRLFSEAS